MLESSSGTTIKLAGEPDSATCAGAPPSMSFLERIEIELARDADAPARARAEVREAIAERLSEVDRANAKLLTSELVTNAVIHPAQGVGGSVGLRITSYADRVRVEVTDAGSGFSAESLTPRPREAGGHGLIVVDRLSSRWGTSRPVLDGRPGFSVWFELDADAEQAAGAGQDQFSTPSRSQQYSSRHSFASSMHRASESQGSTVSNA